MKRGVKELRPGALLTRCLPARILRIAMGRRVANCFSGRADESEETRAMLKLQTIVTPAWWEFGCGCVAGNRFEGAGERKTRRGPRLKVR